MDYSRFIDAAQGKIPASLVVKNVCMLMVTSGEWICGDLAVADGLIVGAGPEKYEGENVIDGSGLFAVPGFIDGHVHIESSSVLPSAFEDLVLPRGTTTAVCDPHELANVCGIRGIRYFLECAEKMTLDLIVQLSSCVPASPLETSGASLNAKDLLKLKDLPHAGGLAELMNVPGVLQKDPAVLDKIRSFSDSPIDGHAPFLSGYGLNAYCGCGVGNDHECSAVQEAMDRIRRGMTVLIREGSAAGNLKTLERIITPETVDFTALCTDDRNILDILKHGHINGMISAMITDGIPPELAYRAASLSPARCFGLNDRGMLAPGKIADFVLLDDVRKCSIRSVFKRGRNVAERKRADFPDHSFALKSVHRARLTDRDLRIISAQTETPVIEILSGGLTTKRTDIELPVDDCGEKKQDVSKDVAKICVIARHGINDNIGKGFVKGFGLKNGALASSIGHDSHNLCVVGTCDSDMVLAVNSLIDGDGGYVVTANGKILAQIRFPVGGLMSEKNSQDLAADLEMIHNLVRKTGCTLNDPFMQLSFLTLPVIPFLKITDKGVFDTERCEFVRV